MVEQAYKTLMDPEKRKVYQRIMREARERVDYERKKENKRREKMGEFFKNTKKKNYFIFVYKECHCFLTIHWRWNIRIRAKNFLKKSKIEGITS